MLQALDRLRSLKVSDVMSRQVVEIAPEQRLTDIAELFAEKDISSAPVIDQHGRCVGVLSAVDFLGHSAREASACVKDVMSKDVRSIGSNESLFKAAQVMCAKHIHRLPVTGDHFSVTGVVSTMDIVAAMLNAFDEAEAVHYQSASF